LNNIGEEIDNSPSDKLLLDPKILNEFADKIFNFKVTAIFDTFEEYFLKKIISDSSSIEKCKSQECPYPKLAPNDSQSSLYVHVGIITVTLIPIHFLITISIFIRDSENSIPKSILAENDILSNTKKVSNIDLVKQKISNFIYGCVIVPCLKEKDKKELLGNASTQEYLNLTCNNKGVIENIKQVSLMQEGLLEKKIKFDKLLEKHKNNEKFLNYKNLEMEMFKCILHTPCIDITILKEDLELIALGNVKFFDLKISKLEDVKINHNLSLSSSKANEPIAERHDSCCLLL